MSRLLLLGVLASKLPGTKLHVSILLLMSMLAGCASLNTQVFSDYDQSQDFSHYQRFSWHSEHPMTTKGDHIINPLIEARLMAMIVSELTNKGFQFVEQAEQADFTVAFSISAQQKLDVWSHSRIGDPLWRHQYYNGSSVNSDYYSDGSLAIDIYDTRTGFAVWHGMRTERLSAKDRREPTFGFSRTVGTILSRFPPGL